MSGTRAYLGGRGWALLCLGLVGALMLAPGSPADEERDSVEALIESLTPQPSDPDADADRAPGPDTTPDCRSFLTRGVQARPVMALTRLQVPFGPGSASIGVEAARALKQVAAALRSERLSSCCFQIEGHTDDQGEEAYNLELSQRRAEAVADYLAERLGIDRKRLIPVGLGASVPIADNASEEGRRRNRRVQIVNLGYGRPTAR